MSLTNSEQFIYAIRHQQGANTKGPWDTGLGWGDGGEWEEGGCGRWGCVGMCDWPGAAFGHASLNFSACS